MECDRWLLRPTF